MIDLLNQLFEKYLSQPETEAEAEAEADTGTEYRLRAVDIASAALSVEVLRADHIVKEEELALFRQTIAEQYRLQGEALEQIMQLAQKEVDNATSLYQFTSKITAVMGPRERARVIYNMWLMAYADNDIHYYEEHLIRKIGALLHVSQDAFIEAKQKAEAKVDF